MLEFTGEFLVGRGLAPAAFRFFLIHSSVTPIQAYQEKSEERIEKREENQNKNPIHLRESGFVLAEKEGFEPSIPLWGIHDFQSCALDRATRLVRIVPVQFRTNVIIRQGFRNVNT